MTRAPGSECSIVARVARRIKKTRLVFCEGAEDKAFFDCIKALYLRDGYSIDIKRGAGGYQVHLVEEAIRRGDIYGGKYIAIDGDRDATEMKEAQQLAVRHNLVMLRTAPCLERLLINILEPAKRTASWSSSKCKKYFESRYISAGKRTNMRTYAAIFTKDILDEARIRLPELDEIINVFS